MESWFSVGISKFSLTVNAAKMLATSSNPPDFFFSKDKAESVVLLSPGSELTAPYLAHNGFFA